MAWFLQEKKKIITYWKFLELALTTSLHQVMIHEIIPSLWGQNRTLSKSIPALHHEFNHCNTVQHYLRINMSTTSEDCFIQFKRTPGSKRGFIQHLGVFCLFVCFPRNHLTWVRTRGSFFGGGWLCQVLLTLHGLSLAAVQGLFIVVASLVVGHGL